MDEKGIGVKILLILDRAPAKAPEIGMVGVKRQRMRGRGQTQHMHDDRLVIAVPAIFREATGGFQPSTTVSPPFPPSASRRAGRARRQAARYLRPS